MKYAVAASAVLSALVGCSDAGPPKPAGITVATAPSAADVMLPLATQPAVQVVDGGGNPVAISGQIVVASMIGPGKIVAGGSAATDASGLATFQNLTLGAIKGVVGPTTIEFWSDGLGTVPAPTQLSCGSPPLFALGERISGTLTNGNCMVSSGWFFKDHQLKATSASKAMVLSFDADFESGLFVSSPTEATLFIGVSGDDLTFKVFAPPGIALVRPAGIPSGVGQFTFTAVEAPEDEPECEALLSLVLPPVNTNQTLRNECRSDDGSLTEYFFFLIPAAGSASITVTSTAFSPRLLLYDPNTKERLDSNVASAHTTTIGHVNQGGGVRLYGVEIRAADGSGSGGYGLELTVTRASAPGAREGSYVLLPVAGGTPVSSYNAAQAVIRKPK